MFASCKDPHPDPLDLPYLDENEGPWTTLTPRQRVAIDAILSGKNWAEAAGAAKVSSRTLWNWRSQPDFAAALLALNEQRFAILNERLLSVADGAFGIIESRMTSGDPDRLKWARWTLNLLVRSQAVQRDRAALREAAGEIAALRARLEAMEQSHSTS